MKTNLARHQFLDYFANIPDKERDRILFNLKGFGAVTFTSAFNEIRSKLEKNEFGDWQVAPGSKIGIRILKELNERGLLKNIVKPVSSFK